MRCPSCIFDNPKEMKFCGECGTPLLLRCPQCGGENPPLFKFCGACGTPLKGQPRATHAAGTDAPRDVSVLQTPRMTPPVVAGPRAEAERRQLTVLFCDLVESTPLATRLDPEELREVIRAYHTVCAQVIERFEGHIAQYLGDGLLVYFGYPRAHEDDAQRAVRAGLGIVDALGPLRQRLRQAQAVSLAVRVGIHTGLVVVGEIGEGTRHERLALGEVPNLAARLQGLAPPDTVLISASTARLVQGWFVCEALDEQTLKGFPEPMTVYRVLAESGVQSRLDLGGVGGLTPLVGREQELKCLLEGWEQAKEGLGQVVVLRGEAGIGKSRLLRALQERLAGEPYTRLECRCSPYAQHSALFPMITLGRRLLQWRRDEPPEVTLGKLEAALVPYDVSLPEVVPLLAALLSLPPSERYPSLELTPERQKQKTLEAILGLLQAHAARQPVLVIVEDLHWIDPSTRELLTLLIEQGPMGCILTVVTGRPEFQPPWPLGGQVTALELGPLAPPEVEQMIDRMTAGKRLPAAVRQEVVSKTDGVPLFVEELTKTVLESGLLGEQADRYELLGPLHSLAIPTTLHDSLMARLDRLTDAKDVAQLGATLGRSFVYELLQAVSPWDEARLQHALAQLVDAELLYQRGVPPRATYIFKHALIQETAYQSLLRSTRLQYHQQTVQVLEKRFPEIAETQPELLAYHCTEAGLPAQAVSYWQQAGQQAVERSANVEAISHFTKGLELLKSLPETPDRTSQELALQLALGPPLRMMMGHTAPEVERVYTRAYEISRQMRDDRQQFSALMGLERFYTNRAMLYKAHELGEKCRTIAQRGQDPVLLREAYVMLGLTSFFLGDPVTAHRHLEQGLALYETQQRRLQPFSSEMDRGVVCLSMMAWALWILGYPGQAIIKSRDALNLAHELSHAYSLAFALHHDAVIRLSRREVSIAQKRIAEMVTLARQHDFAQWKAGSTFLSGWALVEQGAAEEAIVQLKKAQAMWQEMGTELAQTHIAVRLADAYCKNGQIAEGLHVVDDALVVLHKHAENYYAAELQRVKGELLLRQAIESSGTCPFPQATPVVQEAEHGGVSCTFPPEMHAETCFHQALHTARQQRAKSLELRAAMSLSRLWQLQDKSTEARQMLAGVYGWFAEGFDTPNLLEVKALLEALT